MARAPIFQGSGGGKSSGGHTPTEAANSLFSNSRGAIVDLISEGEIEGLVNDAKSIYYNETVLEQDDGTRNFQGVDINGNHGTADQAALQGFDDVRTSVSVVQALPYNTYKTISFPNDGTISAVEVTISTDQFFTVQDDGDVVGSSVSFAIEKSENGGSFTTAFTGSISGKQNDTYDVDYRIAIDNTSGSTAIRVKRTTPDATNLQVHDLISFKLYTKIVEHRLVYPNRAVIGHHFDAKQFGNQLPERAYKIKGIKVSVPHNYDPVKRTYTGSFTGALSGTKQWTNNPAWIFYDLVTNTRYGLGQFFDSSLIDIPSLYTLGKWCDDFVSDGVSSTQAVTSITRSSSTATVTCTAHGYSTGDYILIAGAAQTEYNGTFYVTKVDANTFTYTVTGTPATPATGTITAQKREPRWVCNAYITNRDDAFNVLKELASCFRGVLFWMDGKLWAQADLPRDPVKLVTNANVVDGNFTYSGESNRQRYSVVNVAWNDPDTFYRRAVETYEDPDLIREFGWKATDLQAVGCTSRSQARRLAKAVLYSQEYESELVTYRASFDHMAVEGDGPVGIAPGDLILISDWARGNAVAGGRITNVISSSVFEVTSDSSETITEDVVDVDGVTPVVDADGVTSVIESTTTADVIDWGSGTGVVYLEHAATGTVEYVNCTYSVSTVTLTATPTEPLAVNDLFILVDTGFDPEPFRVIKVSEVDANILEIAAARYNDGKFAAIYGEDMFDATNVMRILPGTFIAAPTVLSVNEGYITNSDFNSRTLEVAWTGVVDQYLDYYEVTYSLNKGTPIKVFTGSTSVSLPHIRPGLYDISVEAVNRLGIHSAKLSGTQTVAFTPADYPAGTTSNLVLQSGGTTFTGKDAAFAWQVTSPTATYVTAAGGTTPNTGFTDPKFRDCVVYVKTTGGTLLRTESVVDTHYTYTFEKNFADNAGSPLRSFKVEVTYRDIYGRESAAVSLTVSNPAPSLSSVTATPSESQLTLVFSPNTDPDFVGTIVWMSTTSGFTPGAGNLVWQAPGNAVIPITPNTTYYYVYAGYDVFGTTGLTQSTQQTVTTPQSLSFSAVLRASYPKNLTVDAIDAGSNATVRCYGTSGGVGTSFTLDYAMATPTDVTIAAHSITGLSYSTTYYVYVDVASLGDTSPTFGVTTVYGDALNSAAHPNRIYLSRSVTTPASGGGTSSGDASGGSYGGTCVTVDTPILMADGTEKRAGNLKVGDIVRTRHELTLEWGNYPIEAVQIAPDEPVYCVLQGNRMIRATALHRVHIGDRWMTAEALGVNFGKADVVKITVTNAHTYISNGILSHNLKPDLP